jgi:hypothetical protein
MGIIPLCAVGIAEWLRRQVVALKTVGSNPTTHPNLSLGAVRL